MTDTYTVEEVAEILKDDLISRQGAIDALQKEINKVIPPFNDVMGSIRCGVRLARNIIEDLPPARQWIPWVENDARLKDHYYYLVTHVWHGIPMLAKFHDDGCYFEIISLYPHKSIYVWENDIITAWMPLPEIYKGEEE